MSNKCTMCNYKNANNYGQDNLETSCKSVEKDTNYNSSCNCGFDDGYNEFPENPMFAQSYVPVQKMNQTFTPCFGLSVGTIFPELVNHYSPGDFMETNKYLAQTNTIGKGCNA